MNLAQVPGIKRSVVIFSDNSGRAHRVGYFSLHVIAMALHAASTKRCTAAAEPTRAGVASTQRSAASTAETPKRWCPATNEPIVTSCRTGNTPPRFPAVSRGGYSPPLLVELRSGSPISLVRESTTEACGFEIVIDEFGYDDYVEVDQPFDIPPATWYRRPVLFYTDP